MNEEFNLLTEQSDQTVDELSESDQNTDSSEIEVYVVNDTYSGTISDTYLDYFAGIAEKLAYNEHYVVWRSGQYEYTMAYGEDLSLNGYYFTGSDLWITRIWRESDSYNSNWYCTHTIDAVDVDCTDLFAYSDLGDTFPTLRRGCSSFESAALLFAVAFMFVYLLVRDFFQHIR